LSYLPVEGRAAAVVSFIDVKDSTDIATKELIATQAIYAREYIFRISLIGNGSDVDKGSFNNDLAGKEFRTHKPGLRKLAVPHHGA